MKTVLSILFGSLLAIVNYAQAQQQPRRVAPHKTVDPAYQQPTSYSPAWSTGSGFKHEVDLNLSEGYFRTYNVGGKNISNLSVFASYSYDIGRNFQVGGDAGFASVDSTTKLTAVGTGTYNLDADYGNSIFFKAGLGLYPVTKISATGKIDDKNEFGLYAAAGKRFKIWDHVNYKPFVAIAKISDLDVQFVVQFLNVSFNFN